MDTVPSSLGVVLHTNKTEASSCCLNSEYGLNVLVLAFHL